MTTRPTIQANKSVGATLGAAEWNTNCLQQGNWTQEVIAGTNSDKIAGAALANPLTLPGPLHVANDANFTLDISGTIPFINFDVGDSFSFQRAINLYQFTIGGVAALTLDSAGLLAGLGFYRSTEVTITNGNNANFAHGLAAKPCNVYGVHGTVTTNNLTIIGQSNVTFGQIDATNINVANASGATRFVLVNATK